MKLAPWPLMGLALASGNAFAGPNDYVFMPTVEYGEREIDFKYGAAGKKGASGPVPTPCRSAHGRAADWSRNNA